MTVSNKHPLDKIALLRESWLADLPDEVVAEAAAYASVRTVDDGTLLHARGDACDGFFTIASGAVRFSRTTADGQATTIAVMEAPNWFGEISIFDGLPRTHDGHAAGRTLLLFHAKSDFKRLLARHPVLYDRFARMLALRLRATFDLVEEAAVAPLSQRLARRLLELAQIEPSPMNAATTPRGREVPLTQEELGQLLGKSRQSIAKLLRAWETDGVVRTNYGRVFIEQPDSLTKLAYPDRASGQENHFRLGTTLSTSLFKDTQ
ncbi:MAG: Crp/Fnr family transcriptional regulator [Herminiimonas sp.]|nr:Crp/Fnr family transcriptional regulator [Herminiimonas sp.]